MMSEYRDPYNGDGRVHAWDIHEGYSLCCNSLLGIIEVLMGLLSIALGVGAICTWATYYFVGYGIWCGVVYTFAGGIAIGAARHKNTCMIGTNTVLQVLSILCAVVQFCLGVVAAYKDSEPRRQNIIAGQYADNFLEYDIYYRKNNPKTYVCAGQNYGLSWKHAWGPVDILLLTSAFIEMVVAIIALVLCAVALCGYRSNKPSDMQGVFYADNTGTTGFSNEGYMTDPRMTPQPPLYKVV